MPKSHIVKLSIKNDSPYPMSQPNAWFDTGGVAEGHNLEEIPANAERTMWFCESNYSLIGCSGYVTYRMNNSFITIAFSNPSNPAKNKLGVGNTGRRVWDEMSDNDYNSFTQRMLLGDEDFLAVCVCTGGDTNNAQVIISHKPKKQRNDREPVDEFSEE